MKTQYGLYQTLSSEKFPSKDLLVKNKKDLVVVFNNLNQEQSEVVFMLICEHARVNDDYKYSPENLPYGVTFEDEKIHFDVNDLPKNLRHILWKFKNIIQ